ncbi:MAG TPA: hypothetical protein VIR63_05840 [Pontiella sp.]
MNRTLYLLSALLGTAHLSTAQPPPALTNAPAAPKSISLQEMLVIGPSGLKLHSLAMITQGKAANGIDASFLPGFKVCSEDTAAPVRSITAKLLGTHFIKEKENPNKEAVALLIELAKDTAADVRYNAVYHGLSHLQEKPDEVIELLIDIAAGHREQPLYERIIQSLEKYKDTTAKILDHKLAVEDNVAVYEIYEDLTGKPPANAEQYLEMPSSRPRMFIFNGESEYSESFQAELEQALKKIGIENPDLSISHLGKGYVLILKTYLTKEYKAVKAAFSDHARFKITQDIWLTPELEIQLEAMSKAQKE